MGQASVVVDIPEGRRSFPGAQDVLLRARAVGQDRGAEDGACGEGADEVKFTTDYTDFHG